MKVVKDIIKKSTKSAANTTAEFMRICELLEVLIDGESYLWEEMTTFFDVEMDTRGRQMFRRAVIKKGRLYSPLAYPAYGLGIVMGEANTVADIVATKQRRVLSAADRVVTTIDIAQDYDNVPQQDRNYMRMTKAQNSALINSWRTKPVKRFKATVKICDGTDMKVD